MRRRAAAGGRVLRAPRMPRISAGLKQALHTVCSVSGGAGSAELSLGAVTELISGKMNVVLSSEPFKDGSGETKPTKTNLMNKVNVL